jgi:hypothetical protein
MDSTAQTPTWDSHIINELLSRVTRGFDSPNTTWDLEIIKELLSRVTRGLDNLKTPSGLKYHQRTAGTGDGWMRQLKHPLGSSRNCCHV